MAVRSTVDMISEADIKSLMAGDEAMARVLADYAAKRADEARATNRTLGGVDTPPAAKVNGTVVPAPVNEAALAAVIAQAQARAADSLLPKLEIVFDFAVEYGPALQDLAFKLWRSSGSHWAPLLARAVLEEAQSQLRGRIEARGRKAGAKVGRKVATSLAGWLEEFGALAFPYIERVASTFGFEVGRQFGMSLARFLIVFIARELGGAGVGLAADVALNLTTTTLLNFLLQRGASQVLFKILRGGDDTDETDTQEVLAWIATELRARSPVFTGRYRDAHMLYADGREVAPAKDVAGKADIPDAKTFMFRNATPYARKIEIGKIRSGRDFVKSVEPHIYERVAKDAQDRFPNADIQFGFGTIGYTLRQNQKSRQFLRGGRVYSSPSQRSDRARGSTAGAPMITIEF